MNFWQCLAHRLLGWQYVMLRDFDGERTVVRARRGGAENMFAWRMPYGFPLTGGVGLVLLLPDGAIGGESYVDSWSPLTPEIR